MARTIYNQKNVVLTVDGVTIQDFYGETPISFSYDGGEVSKTPGLDGAGLNIAADQGATLKFSLRETSRSRGFLADLRKRQHGGGAGVTVVLRTGADILETMTGAYLSAPGTLNSGGEKQGGLQYTLLSAANSTGNLAMSGDGA